METLQTTSFPIHPARFPFARGVVLGALLATSLSALLVQASGADGIFGDYFTRMIEGSGGTGMCPTGKVITGFSVNTSDYGTPICADAPGGDGAPIGTIAAFNSATCPAGWSPANGTSGTPDLRGEFIRGLDGGRGIDSGRVLGTWQKGTLKAYDADSTNATYAQDIGGDGTASANDLGLDVAILSEYPTSKFKQTYINSSYQSLFGFAYGVVRPRNVALLYCMKTSNIVPTPAITWGNTNAATPADGDVVQLTSGNVGIGTSSPTQKLDVEGNVRINGTANVSNANIGQVDTNRICLSGNCRIKAWSEWEDVPLSDVADYNIDCEYRYKQQFIMDANYHWANATISWSYASTISPKYLGQILSGDFYYGVPSSDKGHYYYRTSTGSQVITTNVTILKMEKKCP